jgi:hypothetical protein
MKRYLQFASGHPYLIAALIVVLFLPWAWMAHLVPMWALGISLALVPLAALLALALVIKDVNAEEDAAQTLATDDPFKWRKRTRLFQQVVVGLDTMLERWDTASAANRKRLDTVTESVEEVIKLTEAAVNEISKNFRIVVSKANEQTEAAMSLLQRDDHGRGVLSLPEFIQAYDSQLVNVTSHMTSFSAAADEMASHQKRVTEHAKVMEETIDGLRHMASQISRIALDGSVAMTSQTLNPRDFVDMTDRIRAISQEAHELTRKTRHGLDAIGDEVRAGNKRTTQVAEAAGAPSRWRAPRSRRSTPPPSSRRARWRSTIEPHQRPVGRDPEGHQPHHRGDAVPGHHAPEARAPAQAHARRGLGCALAALARDPRHAAARSLPRGQGVFAKRAPAQELGHRGPGGGEPQA